MIRRKLIWYLADTIIFVFSFALLVLFKFGYFNHTNRILLTALYSFISWTVISMVTMKHHIVTRVHIMEVIPDIAVSNVFVFVSLLILARLRPRFAEIRFLEIYLVLLASFLELLTGWLFVWYNRLNMAPFLAEQENGIDLFGKTGGKTKDTHVPVSEPAFTPEVLRQRRATLANLLIQETDKQVIYFVEKYIDPELAGTSIVSTTTRFNIVSLPLQDYEVIVNLKRLNDIQYINKFIESVNSKLKQNGIFIANAETHEVRKKRLLARYPFGINRLVYLFDFLFKRVAPKLSVTKKLYFFFSGGRNRVLSKAEIYGRLYSCGFEIVETAQIGDRLYFAAHKTGQPCFDPSPTYGPVIRLKRIGIHGKIISVYKFRTMYAYSEYLQQHIYNLNHLQPGGKIIGDFRITTIGRIFRKLWIDEFPMLINLIKGDLKLFGVRPLSQHYFDLYTDELKEKRIKYKPGLVPPFYADLPKTMSEIMESEMRYLVAYEKNPFRTDFVYFWKAVWNILFKKVRSR